MRHIKRHPVFTVIAVLGLIVLFLSPIFTVAHNGSGSGKAVFPNPFKEGTTFELYIPPPGSKIKIDVYNIRGQHIRNLFPGREGADPEEHEPGQYPIPWDGRDKYGEPVVPGIYICALYAGNNFVKSVKVVKVEK